MEHLVSAYVCVMLKSSLDTVRGTCASAGDNWTNGKDKETWLNHVTQKEPVYKPAKLKWIRVFLPIQDTTPRHIDKKSNTQTTGLPVATLVGNSRKLMAYNTHAPS